MEKLELYLFSRKNEDKLRDRYDFESAANPKTKVKAIRLDKLFPNSPYHLGLIKHGVWDENVMMLASCALDLGRFDEADEYYDRLIKISEKGNGFGLPVDWHSGDNVFPAGTIMSTTTSETLLFMLRYGQERNIDNLNDLHRIASDLLNQLKVVETGDDFVVYSYTPYDDYRVINSNLLVAAALAVVGNESGDKELFDTSKKILTGVIRIIPENGGLPYNYNDGTIDSYHQVFCIRALLELSQFFPEAKPYADKCIGFLEKELIDENYRVYLTPEHRAFDLQGTAEVIGLYKELGLTEKYDKTVAVAKETFNKGNKLLQTSYLNAQGNQKYVHTAFARQGFLRLAKSL